MLISVIVPIFNSEQYLEKCIDSIQRQTYKELEIIFVNDGSTDHSLTICEKFKEKDQRIKIISQKNKGLIAARKAGIEAATGDLIGFVDSDDWIEPAFYDRMMDIYQRYGCDLISTGIIREYVDSSREEIVYDNYAEGCYWDLQNEIYPTMLYDNRYESFGLYCNLVNKLFKRKVLEDVYENINTEIFYGEDGLALYDYCLRIKSVYILKEAFYHYIIRNDSMCRTVDMRLLQNGYMLYHDLETLFSATEQKYILMRQLKKYFLMTILTHNMQMLYGYNVGMLGDWKFYYPKEVYDSRIVIYGAGSCGQALYSQFIAKRLKDNVVAWLDRDWKNKSEECMFPIGKPEVISELEFDYVIIAISDENIAIHIRKDLSERYFVPKEKIIWQEVDYIALFGNVHF